MPVPMKTESIVLPAHSSTKFKLTCINYYYADYAIRLSSTNEFKKMVEFTSDIKCKHYNINKIQYYYYFAFAILNRESAADSNLNIESRTEIIFHFLTCLFFIVIRNQERQREDTSS